MSKKQARRLIATEKPGCTVKEFLEMCNDLGFWFDIVCDVPIVREMYEVLQKEM